MAISVRLFEVIKALKDDVALKATKIYVDEQLALVGGSSSAIVYNPSSGVLIKLFDATTLIKMVTIVVKGNGFSGLVPIDTIIQGYHYTPSGTFVNYSQLDLGYALPVAKFFLDGGYVCCWFDSVSDFQTLVIEVYTQTAKITPVSITNAVEPTGTNKVTCVSYRGWHSLNSVAFLTAEKTKLAGIANNANNYVHPATHSADVIVDGTTNHVFTAADDTKLAGIEAGATVDMTAAEILAALLTVDGATSGLDAQYLAGATASVAAGAFAIVKRDANGYIANTWFNSNRGEEASAAASYIYDTGDGYMRKKSLGNARNELALGAYPVGSIFMSTVSTSPATLFGGTWVAIADKFLVGAGATFGAGSTGGAMSHIHSIAAHIHSLSAAAWAQISAYTGYLFIKRSAATGWAATNKMSTTYTTDTSTNNYGASLAGNTDYNAAQNTSDVSHLPPYQTVYMWQRTV